MSDRLFQWRVLLGTLSVLGMIVGFIVILESGFGLAFLKMVGWSAAFCFIYMVLWLGLNTPNAD